MRKVYSRFKDKFGCKIYYGDIVELDNVLYIVEESPLEEDIPVLVALRNSSLDRGELVYHHDRCTLMSIVPAIKLEMTKSTIEDIVNSNYQFKTIDK